MTTFSRITSEAAKDAMDRLKRRNAGQKLVTNYFQQGFENAENLRAFECENSFCLLFDEWDFARFYFYSYNITELQADLQGLTWPPIVVADWISKQGTAPADLLLSGSGFHLHTVYDRMYCRNLRREPPPSAAQMAGREDVEKIHHSLLQVFDKYADHVISVNELLELVSRQQVIVSRGQNGEINGYIIFPISGQSCHFNFLYNCGGPAHLAHLLGNFYGALHERGVQSAFGWVRRSRPFVLKLHQSFGWNLDGLVDYIYVR